MNIDKEWSQFLSSNNNNENDDDFDDDIEENAFYNKDEFSTTNISYEYNASDIPPKASDIYISTKSKIIFLNSSIDLKNVFWNIPVIPYSSPLNGVIKKQMKFNSTMPEELDFIKSKLVGELYTEEHIITNINNPTGRIKFKDVRKISIGLCKKDLLSYRCKKKSAFYNCFVLIVRMKNEKDNDFKEHHVKIFNTGKIGITGVRTEEGFYVLLKKVIEIIQPFIETKLEYIESSSETILINSNFNTGFFINREALYDILKLKYNIEAIYDPCSYPGIQCKFYYNANKTQQNGCQNVIKNVIKNDTSAISASDCVDINTIIKESNLDLSTLNIKVSFMVFRTGSILIVGKCDENILLIIYEFLKRILHNEYVNICQQKNKMELDYENSIMLKDKNKKIRKKNIIISTAAV
jgi:TATA-box binding protein (TBP) (component of TFIID and TFIIIB)